MNLCSISPLSGYPSSELFNPKVASCYAALVALLLWLIRHELRTGLIPNKVLGPAGIGFLIYNVALGHAPAFDYVKGAMIGLMVPLLFNFVCVALIRGGSIGLGAIKLLMVVGAALGSGGAIFTAIAYVCTVGVMNVLVALYYVLNRRVPVSAVASSPIIFGTIVAWFMLPIACG